MYKNILIALAIVIAFSTPVYGATFIFPSGGGTGTSTAPTYGQMLVGNAGGTYTLTATSSLGIITTGIVPIANGGTATSTQVTNGVNYFDGTKITSGTALTFNGTTLGTPIFNATQGSGTSTIATGQGFTIGSSQFVLQQGSGNVGIGIAAPVSLLNVNAGELWLTGQTSQIANNNGLDIYGGTNGGTVYARGDNNGGDDHLVLKAVSDVQIAPGTTQTAVFKSGGNVGIGTTTPYAKLSVTNTGTTPSFIVEDTTSPDSSPFVIDASGNVGIGTASPSTPLHVYTTSGTGFQVGDNSNGTIKIGDGTLTKNAGAMWTVGSSGFSAINGSASVVSFSVNGLNTGMFGTATSLSFGVGGNEKLTVLSTGNIGIGTTTPYAQFSIATPNGATGSLSTLFAIASSTQTGATTTLMTVRASGNVGIGTTSPTSLMQLFSTGTTTTSIDSDSATKGGCIEIKDRSGVGYTYITAEDGVLTASTVSCK